MGKSQRDKGARGERELVHTVTDHGLHAVKISRSGHPGPDVLVEGLAVEVKRRGDGQQLGARQLEQLADDVHAVAWRFDQGRWHVTMRLEEWLFLLNARREEP